MRDTLATDALVEMVLRERRDAHFDCDMDESVVVGMKYADAFGLNVDKIMAAVRSKKKDKIVSA